MIKQCAILLGFGLLMSGCFSNTTDPTTPTNTPSPIPSSTPTILWFPPTPTNTPIPTHEVTATPNLQSNIGEILFRDNFSNPSVWSLALSNRGSAVLGVNELTIAISEPNEYSYSIREQPILDDFYAEITVQPNLCSGTDEYGILFRYQSNRSFYRFSLSCDGQVRLDRVLDGKAASPQPWMPIPIIPRGAPSESRLGIWVNGKELRFFINDQYLFGVEDGFLKNGSLGVFARSAGDNAVTVIFSDMVVSSVNQ